MAIVDFLEPVVVNNGIILFPVTSYLKDYKACVSLQTLIPLASRN